MDKILYGCQTYSWQMSFEKYAKKIPQIASVMKRAGFQGIEAEVCMLGNKYFPDREKLNHVLKKENLQFAALALPLLWREEEETEEERQIADTAIEFVKGMKGSILVLCHLPGRDRKDLRQRQDHQIRCITEVAKRAEAEGVTTVYHPNSSYGSIFRTREDYEYLFDGIAGSCLGYAPDAGHIAHGGMDPKEVISTYYGKVKHVHFKDMGSDGSWKSMGEGGIDFPGIVKMLKEKAYKGWIMVEEESEDARKNPDLVTLENGQYIQKL